jgi:hypothetical protein
MKSPKVFLLILVTSLLLSPVILAQDMGGWEKGGTYDRLYQSTELDRLKGEIEKVIEVVPLTGMAPGFAFILEDGDGEDIEVHVGPIWFLGEALGLSRGDKVKVRGSWAEIEGREVFLAAKIKKGDFFELKVRLTKDGTPFWTLSEEELAKEQAAGD